MTARIDHAVVSGTFSLDGETHEVDNNIWVVGDEKECVVIDAPHDVEAIMAVVGERSVRAILLTHAHDDHCRVAPALRERANGGQGAPIMLHPAEKPLWELTHTDHLWDVDLADGFEVQVGGTTLRAIHTPGHAPGAVCFHAPALGVVFTGDTLFQGGPGATGRSFSDRPTLEASIRANLWQLPDDTVVHTGHGDDTTIGAEKALLG
ncbi:MBL fold metallo-hydrolase [Nocardioides sp.]|uniref:MBL fold metallo-hydrolase n=1 Tax=Nocardioides sp. TaxID=35761 RepID=UPI00260221F9|nr:MBL fold metallo-hydrolase [Nocardioides sp.]